MSAFVTRVASALLRVAAMLPLSVLHWIAVPLACCVRQLGLREARVAARNIQLCFPQLEPAARQQMLRDSLTQTACGLLELPLIWGRRPQRALALVREVRGAALLDSALAAGRGVLVAAPHLGAWELLNLWLSSRWPLTVLYRAPESAMLEAILVSARGALGAEQIRAEPAGVRTLLRRLHAGRMVGILPDQRPRRGEGTEAPFFGHPRHSMTLFSRLAQRSGAAVLFVFAERLPNAGGFRIHVLPADPAIADADPLRAATALNDGLTACIAVAPAQYQWTYKIFGYWEPGDPPNLVYVNDPARAQSPRSRVD